MSTVQPAGFVDRRAPRPDQSSGGHPERRQFTESRDGLSPDVRELAEAIDAFKVTQHRRYVTLTEVMEVVKRLGYHK